jgi:catechol 2,3-dioxygenase
MTGVLMLPLHLTLGPLALRVHNIERMYAFYAQALQLKLLQQSSVDGSCMLGSETQPLLHLIPDTTAQPAPRSAGLYHVAFLYPSRAALASVVRHYTSLGLRIQGASDHGVSEAFYLADPEGNGIELYADRPMAQWPRTSDGTLAMVTDPIDIDGIMACPVEVAAPVIGHMHLHVSDLARAQAFYHGVLGFDVMQRYGGQAEFVSAAGYHHHLGYNVWRGRNIPPAPTNATGLMWWTINLHDADAYMALKTRITAAHIAYDEHDDALWVRDGDGIQIRIVAA